MGATVPIACVLFLVAFDLWRLASYCKTGVDACSANILSTPYLHIYLYIPYITYFPVIRNLCLECCIKLNQSRRSRKATTGQPATSCDRPAAAAAASRLHTIGRQPPSHLKVEISCFEFVYK